MKIAFDMDGVLSCFDARFTKLLNSMYGAGTFPETPPTCWNWADPVVAGSERAGFEKLKTISNFWLSLDPYKTNVEAADQAALEYDMHDFYVLTARSQSAGCTVTDQTRQWLGNYAPRLEASVNIITVAKPALKRQVLEGIGITAMIDDYGPTVEAFDQMENFQGYLLDQPWNQDAKVKNRVKSVAEFLERIGCPTKHLV